MRKLIAFVFALVLILGYPTEAQAAKCTSSQLNQIRTAQNAVDNARRNLGYQQGYLRLQQSSVKGAQSAQRSAQSKVDGITRQINQLYAKEATANRVELIDIQVKRRKLEVDLSNAEWNLKTAQANLDRELKWLDIKQRNVDDAAAKLQQKQDDLARYQSKCSIY